MKNPQLAWAAVVIVFVLVAGAVTLAALGKDTTVILTLAGAVAVPVLGGFGAVIYQKLDKVDSNTNGTNTDLLNTIKDLHNKITELALLVPTPAKENLTWPAASESSSTPSSPPTTPQS